MSRGFFGRTPLAALLLVSTSAIHAQPDKANYDESKVGTYTLPEPLVLANGTPVRDAKAWMTQRRPEILALFETHMQGRSPAKPQKLSFDVFDNGTLVFDGKARRKQVEIRLAPEQKMDLLVYTPAAATKPVPMVLYISFYPNAATVDDSGIRKGEYWTRDGKRGPITPEILKRPKIDIKPWLDAGFGFATVYYCDIEPDFKGGIKYGLRGKFLKPGQTDPEPDEWGAIGAWAWGLSRALDYLQTDRTVDAKRVALVGLSRLGKTVLWAGAQDQRFAAVISACSGEGGGSLSRRNYGETVADLNRSFPFWFSRNYLKYGPQPEQLPVDAHMLLALIAPRPVYLSTGQEDRWADPKGEFLTAVAAGPVYRLLGQQDLGTDQMPGPDQPIMHTIGFHMHSGGHAITPYDWEQYLKFLSMHLKK